MTVSNVREQESRNVGTAGSVKSNLTYLLIGGGIGATLALLFAPKSGADLRSDISDLGRKGYDETLELASNLKDHSTDLFHSLKEKTDKVYDLAAAKLSRAGDLSGADETPGEVINGEIRAAADRPASRSTGTGRKSSDIF